MKKYVLKDIGRRAAVLSTALLLCSFSVATAFADAPPDMPGGNGAGGGGANTMSYDYSGGLAGKLTADSETVKKSGKTYSSDTADVNSALVENGGKLTLTNGTLKKTGDDTNGDNCNFYGINSILLSTGSKSRAYISGSKLTSNSTGSNGIFATDSGKVYAKDLTIKTSDDNSRGLDATYNGSIIGDNITINTTGAHCAAIATDRGGGNISLANSALNTAGSGSPLLYSTGNIQVNNVTGSASGSQIAGMEGLNTIYIYNSNLLSTNKTATASDPIANGVIIYQSTSGDAESTTGETAKFEASNSTLKSSIESGSMFYLTNTKANVVLSNTNIEYDSSKANLFTVGGNDSNNWGTSGSNGAEAKVTALGETLKGKISVDTISSLKLYLLEKTTYTGKIEITTNDVNTDRTSSPITVNVDKSSKWIVTGDSTVSKLNAEEGSQIVDSKGKTVTIIANGKTVVDGDSQYKITVTGKYTTTVNTSDDNSLSDDYISRTSFDKYYNTTTAFGESQVAETTKVETSKEESDDASILSPTMYFALGGLVIIIVVSGLLLARKRN